MRCGLLAAYKAPGHSNARCLPARTLAVYEPVNRPQTAMIIRYVVNRVSRPISRTSPRAWDVYLDSIGGHGIFSIVMSLSLQTVRDRFPALQYRDFRLLWFGQVVSLTGSRMQQTAVLWHMYQLTESAYALGAMAVIRFIPLLLILSPLAGVITDTHDRRRVLLLSQCGLALISTTLAWITWSGHDSATTCCT